MSHQQIPIEHLKIFPIFSPLQQLRDQPELSQQGIKSLVDKIEFLNDSKISLFPDNGGDLFDHCMCMFSDNLDLVLLGWPWEWD